MLIQKINHVFFIEQIYLFQIKNGNYIYYYLH